MSTSNMHTPALCWIIGSLLLGLGIGLLMNNVLWFCIVMGLNLMCMGFITMLIKIGDRL